MIPLRFATAAFMIVVATSITLLFVTPVWPQAAFDYYEWGLAQPTSDYLQVVSFIVLCLAAVAWVSAAALFFGKLWARWPFAAATAIALLLTATKIPAGALPLLVSPHEVALAEASSLLAGFIIAISFFGRTNVAP